MSDHLSAIFEAIRRERAYQDAKWGNLKDRHHGAGEWILIMQAELDEARQDWVRAGTNDLALCEILQVVAVGCACLEQHGIVERHTTQSPQESRHE